MNVTGFKKHHQDKRHDEANRGPLETSHDDFKHGHQQTLARLPLRQGGEFSDVRGANALLKSGAKCHQGT